eukprot:TRINITY_DN11445_c0_g1_i1.p1 TRINITY_DN11445_c0_g1~~TRINITY_DN11445_c0_g1_i1.p1  ORF type:complete len:141 (-),score=23.44 TRINITY_DN11445_c0_g1_i1:97-519(-)
MFGIPGKKTTLFRHIRQFSGWNFSEQQEEVKIEKVQESLTKLKIVELKPICEVCDVEINEKAKMVAGLIEFLKCPKSSGRPLKSPKKESLQVVQHQRRERKTYYERGRESNKIERNLTKTPRKKPRQTEQVLFFNFTLGT